MMSRRRARNLLKGIMEDIMTVKILRNSEKRRILEILDKIYHERWFTSRKIAKKLQQMAILIDPDMDGYAAAELNTLVDKLDRRIYNDKMKERLLTNVSLMIIIPVALLAAVTLLGWWY